MNIERRWVTVLDNSQGNLDDLFVVQKLVEWHTNEGELFEANGYQNPTDRLNEVEALLDMMDNYASGAIIDVIRSQWLSDWLEYLLDIDCDLQIHEDIPGLYGYWNEFLPCGHEIYSCRCTGPCISCGQFTYGRNTEFNFKCLACDVAELRNR